MDHARLRNFVSDFISSLKPGNGIHMPSLVREVFNQSTNPRILAKETPIAPFESHDGGRLPGEDVKSYEKRYKAWEKDVRKAILEVLREDSRVTEVCPNPPKGFWRL